MSVSNTLENRLSAIRHVFLDMDGTIYHGSTLYPTTLPFLQQLQELGVGYTFLTNNSSRCRADYVRKLKGMGLDVSAEQVFTSTHYTIAYLREHHSELNKIFVLGVETVVQEFREAGFLVTEEQPEAVVVCYDTTLSYDRLCRAGYWINQGKKFVSTHPDVFCPTDQPTLLVDCGAITKCLETATGIKPLVLGKPDPGMIKAAAGKAGIPMSAAAMAGDRLKTDVQVALNAGAFAVHIDHVDQENAPFKNEIIPDLSISHLGQFGDALSQAQL